MLRKLSVKQFCTAAFLQFFTVNIMIIFYSEAKRNYNIKVPKSTRHRSRSDLCEALKYHNNGHCFCFIQLFDCFEYYNK